MKVECVNKKQLDAISEEMIVVYGCRDVCANAYAQIINLLIAEYYDEGIVLFLQMHKSKILKVTSLNTCILRYYSQAMIHQHKFEQLVGCLEGIIDDYSNAELYNNYAVALYYSGEKSRAVENLKKALKICNSDSIKRNLEKIEESSKIKDRKLFI